MLFNSAVFLVFFALFISAWPLLRRRRNGRWIYLVAASFVFYGWWDWQFLFLIVGSGLINFFSALGMHRWPARRKAFLLVGILANLGVLAVFKYANFLLQNVNDLASLWGADWQIPLRKLTPVVGISFYTFQGMSYAIDVYRRDLAPTKNVFHFFAYLSMFPQLVAGPIVRAADLVPQLLHHRPTTEARRWEGLKLILYGYFKKCVVADTIAPVVNAAFSAKVVEPSAAYWWMVMLLFSYQIYCDFSGYSDIARGLGRWMGYDFPVNFNHPYIANSFRDFWGRWHISLSTWFRDYVYIPLGGSRKGKLRAGVNMWIAMLVSGLWHGANWAFLAWGGVHSLLLTLERVTKWPKKLSAVPVVGRHVATLLVFLLVTVAWVFFRSGTAGSVAQAWTILSTMFDFTRFRPGAVGALIDNSAMNLMGLMVLRQLWFHFHLDSVAWPLPARLVRVAQPVGMALLLVACVFLRGPGSQFIYFQF